MRKFTIAELASQLGVEFRGEGDCLISGLAPLSSAGPGQASFLNNKKYRKYLPETKASVVILAFDEAERCPTNVLLSDNPYLGYAKLAELFYPTHKPEPGIHPTAIIGNDCNIDPNARIGPHCVIGNQVTIAADAIIESHCVIGDQCRIGAGTVLNPRVTFYTKVRVGERVIIHSGAVLGADGFGFAQTGAGWYKVPQVGGVLIGNDVEIGANTTIDRGALDDTLIGSGVKLDNQIQIGHNVKVGANTIMAGCVGVAGSTTIGKNCMIGGAACINGHISIADNVMVAAMAGVVNSLTEQGVYISGLKAVKHQKWRKNAVQFQYLDKMAKRLAKLEKEIALENNKKVNNHHENDGHSGNY